eukprot:scaffold2130_cov402-Prasinococcus_capsulatus_cf.AAC.6
MGSLYMLTPPGSGTILWLETLSQVSSPSIRSARSDSHYQQSGIRVVLAGVGSICCRLCSSRLFCFLLCLCKKTTLLCFLLQSDKGTFRRMIYWKDSQPARVCITYLALRVPVVEQVHMLAHDEREFIVLFHHVHDSFLRVTRPIP